MLNKSRGTSHSGAPLQINSADSVNISGTGIWENICITANTIGDIPTSIVGPNGAVFVGGRGPSSTVGDIGMNGDSGDVDVFNTRVNSISGDKGYIHVHYGHVNTVNGSFKQIHLHNGSTIGTINGSGEGIWLHDASSSVVNPGGNVVHGP